LSGKELDGYQGPLKARFAFAHFAKILNGHRPNSATCQPIPVMFGSRVGFSARTDGTALFRVCWNPRRRPFWKIQRIISLKRIIRFTLCMHTVH